MAAITEIRKRSGILIFIIGLSLVAFIMMDALSSDVSLLSGGDRTTVAEINGNKIKIQEFEQEVQKSEERYMAQTGQTNLDEQTRFFIREQTWDRVIRELIMGRQWEELGINVTTREMKELFWGTNPHPVIRQQFTNPETGEFDPAYVRYFYETMDQDQTGQQRLFANILEENVRQSQLNTKYYSLIRKGLYIPTPLAKNSYINQTKKANIEFVYIPYTVVADDQVQVTESDLKDYLEKNNARFQQEESRTIEFVVFDIIPSPEDTQQARQWITEKTAELKATDKDSLFIRRNSDLPFSSRYWAKEELQTEVADSLFKVDTGTVIGPFIEDGQFKSIKLLDRKRIPDSVKVRHILIQPGQNLPQAAAKERLDSIQQAIEGGADFAELARKYSADGSAAQGGEIEGWVKPDQMVQPFNNAIFYTPQVGKLQKVTTQFGYHLVEVTDTAGARPAVKAAFLTHRIEPSSETEDKIFDQANEFASEVQAGDFDKAVQKSGVTKRTAENIQRMDMNITGIGPARNVVQWAYQAEEGETSGIYTAANADKLVIAKATKVNEEGTIPLADIRPQLEVEVRNRKKAEKIKEKIGNNPQDLAKVMENYSQATLKTASGITFESPFITGVGQEPEVVGTVFGLKEGSISKPIAGNTGVFVVKATQFQTPQIPEQIAVYKNQQSNLLQSRAQRGVFEALKEKTDIEDNRYKFY